MKDRLDKVEKDARDDQFRCDQKISTLELRQRELEDMLLGRRALGFFSAPEPVPTPVAQPLEKMGGTP